ncbi:MAG: hypothetical protein QM820_59460 [Minicystis sp.]
MATRRRGQFMLLPPPPDTPLPPEARRFLDSLAAPAAQAPVSLRREEDALLEALGLRDGAKLGTATLDHDADGSLWVLVDTPAGKIPLRPVSQDRGEKIECRIPNGGSVSDTYLVKGAPVPLAVQLRKTINVIAVDDTGQCLDLGAKMPVDYLPETTNLSVREAASRPAGAAHSYVGPLMSDAPEGQRLDLYADRIEVFAGDQRVARSDDLLWPGLTGRPLRETRFWRLDGGGFTMRIVDRRKSASRPPLPEFLRLFPAHEEEESARIAVLPDGRVLPVHTDITQDRWELGVRDARMCGAEQIPRCDDRVLQEHGYDDTTGSSYFYRKAGVLRRTTRSITRTKITRDPAKKCMHFVHEEKYESKWYVRSWSAPQWYALSAATFASRDEGIRTIRWCSID